LIVLLFFLFFVMANVIGSIGSYVGYGRTQSKKRIRQHRLPLLVVFLVMGIFSVLQSTIGVDVIMDAAGDPVQAMNITGIILQVLSSVFGLIYGIGMVKL
jgi:hypothetical protein